MDLIQLDTKKKAQEGTRCYFTHPGTGAQLGVYMVLQGQDSDTFMSITHEKLLKNVNKKVKSKEATMNDIEKIEAEDLQFLVALTTGLGETEYNPKGDGKDNELDYITYDGKKLKYNPANVEFLYTNLTWMRDQAKAFVGDRANFLA